MILKEYANGRRAISITEVIKVLKGNGVTVKPFDKFFKDLKKLVHSTSVTKAGYIKISVQLIHKVSDTEIDVYDCADVCINIDNRMTGDSLEIKLKENLINTIELLDDENGIYSNINKQEIIDLLMQTYKETPDILDSAFLYVLNNMYKTMEAATKFNKVKLTPKDQELLDQIGEEAFQSYTKECDELFLSKPNIPEPILRRTINIGNKLIKKVKSCASAGVRLRIAGYKDNGIEFNFENTHAKRFAEIYVLLDNVDTEKIKEDFKKAVEEGFITEIPTEEIETLQSKTVREEMRYLREYNRSVEEDIKLRKEKNELYKKLDVKLESLRAKYLAQSKKEEQESQEIEELEDNGERKLYSIYIGIDCAPGPRFQSECLKEVLKIIGIATEENVNKEASSKLFGAWKWYFTEELNPTKVKEIKNKIKVYFDSKYEQGYIRGAEWNFTEVDKSEDGHAKF